MLFWVSLGIVVVIVLAGYTGLRCYTMASNLMSINNEAKSVAASMASGSTSLASNELTDRINDITKAAQAASNAAGDPTVAALAALPKIGDDVQALRSVAQIANQLSGPAAAIASLIPTLQDNSSHAEQLTRIQLLAGSLTTLNNSVAAANERINKIDTTQLVGPLAQKVTTLRTGLADMSTSLERMTPFASAMPAIMGANGKRTWFVAMQNLGEARPSGGLIGAYVILKANNGALTIDAQGSDDALAADKTVTKAYPSGLKTLWGDSFNTWLSFNLSANFPTNAKAIRATWKHHSGQTVDGVIALGQGTVSYLGAAAGTIHVAGKTITPSELSNYLTVGVYRDFPDPKQKDAMVAKIIGTIFQKLSTGQFDAAAFLKAALTEHTADYLQIWSSSPSEQAQLESDGVAGELSDAYGPDSTVRIVNAAGNKIDSFMQLGAKYTLGRCFVDHADNSQQRVGSVAVDIKNGAPKSGLPKYMTGRLDLGKTADKAPVGSTLSYVLIYPPVEAVDRRISVDGKTSVFAYGNERRRQFYAIPVTLNPGQTRHVKATWQEPSQDPDTGRWLGRQPTLTLPPLVRPATVATPLAASSCSQGK